MRRIAGFVAFLIVMMSVMSLDVPRSNAQLPADLILTNGRILTVDARDSIAEARPQPLAQQVLQPLLQPAAAAALQRAARAQEAEVLLEAVRQRVDALRLRGDRLFDGDAPLARGCAQL